MRQYQSNKQSIFNESANRIYLYEKYNTLPSATSLVTRLKKKQREANQIKILFDESLNWRESESGGSGYTVNGPVTKLKEVILWKLRFTK